MNPTVKLSSTGGSGGGLGQVMSHLAKLSRPQVYVGIPASKADRRAQAGKGGGPSTVNNAELMYIHTHGARTQDAIAAMEPNLSSGMQYSAALQLYLHSTGAPPHAIPPRPIVEPAIEDQRNREIIAAELKLAAQAELDGKPDECRRHLKRAGMLAQNIVRAWFVDPRNGWAPNRPSTIKAKGSDRPLIDTAQMRRAVTYVLADGAEGGQ